LHAYGFKISGVAFLAAGSKPFQPDAIFRDAQQLTSGSLFFDLSVWMESGI
jgi:hypothetical protein